MDKLHNLQLPLGKLIWESETSFYVSLPFEHLTAIEQALFRIAQLQSKSWLIPQMVIEGNEIRIKYYWPQQLRPVAAEVSSWRTHPKVNLIRWLKLSENLDIAYSEAASIELLPPCPYTVFITSSPEHQLDSVYKFPAIPMFAPGLKDWATASPQLWQWASSSILLKMGTNKVAYWSAAAFYYGLVEAFVPEHIPIREQYMRHIRGHNFNSRASQKQLSGAFPKSMLDEEVLEVNKILTAILSPSFDSSAEHKIHPDQTNLFLEFIQNKVSVLRLASRWEHEGNYTIAMHLWSEQAQWNGSENVSWWRVARLYERLNKVQEVQQALMKGLDLGQEDVLEQALNWMVQQLRKNDNAGIQFNNIKTFIERCDQTIAANGMDSALHDLQVAHLFLKYGDNVDEASRRLIGQASTKSTKVLQNLIKVKILLYQPDLITLDVLKETSQLCQESIKLLNLKLFSSFQTHSALSYFYAMDAISNLFAIIRLGDNSYLKDAYQRFTSGMDVAIKNNEQYMISNIGQWLQHLITVVEYFPENIKFIIRISIPLYFDTQRSKGVVIENTPGAFPEQPWYNEDLIFYAGEGSIDNTTA